jgi:hypothetical protein
VIKVAVHISLLNLLVVSGCVHNQLALSTIY